MEKQVRIFVPPMPLFLYDNWYENLLGNIIKPMIEKYMEHLKWFWFSKYVHPNFEGDNKPDCNIERVTDDYKRPLTQYFYDIRFRYDIEEEYCNQFEDELLNISKSYHCLITDFLPYESIQDVGNERHLEAPRDYARRLKRAKLINNLYHQIALLVLDILTKNNDDQYSFPSNQEVDFNLKSSFRVPLHLFCNMANLYMNTNEGERI